MRCWCGTPNTMTENCNGPEIFTQRLKRRQQRHAAAQAWHSQARERGARGQGQKPKAGYCHRSVRGAQEGQEGSEAEIVALSLGCALCCPASSGSRMRF